VGATIDDQITGSQGRITATGSETGDRNCGSWRRRRGDWRAARAMETDGDSLARGYCELYGAAGLGRHRQQPPNAQRGKVPGALALVASIAPSSSRGPCLPARTFVRCKYAECAAGRSELSRIAVPSPSSSSLSSSSTVTLSVSAFIVTLLSFKHTKLKLSRISAPLHAKKAHFRTARGPPNHGCNHPSNGPEPSNEPLRCVHAADAALTLSRLCPASSIGK
jgi:hypothetical protein